MPSIKLSDFKGKVPRVSEKLLPENFAQTANNCDLFRGKISAVKDLLSQSQAANLITDPVKIYKFEDDWLSGDKDADVVRSPLGVDTPRIYISTGDNYPSQTSQRMATYKGAYFTLNAPGGNFQTEYYVYITVDGFGNSTPLPDLTKTVITAAILSTDTKTTAATKIAAAINAEGDFVASAVGAVITVTNAVVGVCVNAISEDCGFTIETTTQGFAVTTKQVTTITIKETPNPSGVGYPIAGWRLGVPAPEVALTLTGTGTNNLVGIGDGHPIRSTNWVYTYVTAWGEESKPSPPTETVDIQGVSQQTAVTCEAIDFLVKQGGAAALYFTFSVATGPTNYYCWYKVDDSGVDPAPGGTGVPVELLGTDSPDQVASKIATAIDGLAGCSAVAEGPLVTITDAAFGNPTSIADATSEFTTNTVTEGNGSTCEVSTVDTSRLVHGSYFKLNTISSGYYVWYQIASVPGFVLDFTSTTGEIVGGDIAGAVTADYFILYLMYPDVDNPNEKPIQKKILVFYSNLSPVWDKYESYNIGDQVSWGGSIGPSYVYEKIGATTVGVEPSATAGWEKHPGFPSVDDVDVIVNPFIDTASDSDATITFTTYEALKAALSDVANISIDTSNDTISIFGLYEGSVTNPSASGIPHLEFVSTYGKGVSDDPGVPGRTGIEVGIKADSTAIEIAELTAEAVNANDAFSCEKPTTALITIVNEIGGEVDDAEDGNTGFTILESVSGTIQKATFSMPAVNASNSDVNISHIRLYRAVTSASGNVEYQLVPTYEPFDEDAGYAVGDAVMYGGYAYYCHTTVAAGLLPTDSTYFVKLDSSAAPVDVALTYGLFDRHGYDSSLLEVLFTEEWDQAPDDLHGLTLFDNGIMVGFSKNKVYFTEPLHPYVWPDTYALDFPDTVVGLGYMPGAIIVLTEGRPYSVIGNDPQTLSQMPLPFNQPCLYKRGIIMTERGVVYPSPDGLFEISQGGGRLISKQLYTKEQWEDFATSAIIGQYFDDKTFFAINETNATLYIDFTEEPFVVDMDHIDTDDVTRTVYDITEDGDDLYFLLKKASVYDIFKYRSATSYKTLTWKSKVFQWPYVTNFACGRVIADWSTSPTVTLKLYVDGTLKQTVSVTSSEVFRLVSGFIGRRFEIEVSGSVDIDFIGIASSPMELFL